MNTANLKKYLSLLLISALSFVQIVEAATVTLATAPIANLTTSVVHPNVMFVLDNSGSMAWNYLPDYVSSGSGGTGSQICWDGINDSDNLATCSNVSSTGSDVTVPFATSDINFLYYNPAIHYAAPIKADKTSYPNSTVTAAYTDGFAASGSTNFKTGTTVATITGTTASGSATVTGLASSEGLVGTFVTGSGIPADAYVTSAPTGTSITLNAAATASASTSLTFKSGAYSHQVFCNTGSPTAQNLRGDVLGTGTVCKETLNTSSGSLYPLDSVVVANKFTQVKNYSGPAFYYTMTPRSYCTNSFYTDCTAAADGTHTVPALYRWCSTYTPATTTSAGTFNNCQDIRDQTHTIPDYLGSYIPGTAGTKAYADLTVSASPTPALSITALTLGGAINSVERTANVVTVTTAAPHGLAVGQQVVVNATNTTGINGTFTITAVTSTAKTPPDASNSISYAQAGGNIASVADTGTAGFNLIGAGSLPIIVNSGNTATQVATAICSAINANSGFSGYNCPTVPTSGTLRIQDLNNRTATNGYIVGVVGPRPPVAGVKASGTIVITSTPGATKIDDITVGGTSVMTTKPWYFPDGTDTTDIATQLASLIGGGTYTATSSGPTITITKTSNGPDASAAVLVATPVSGKATITANSAVGASGGAIGAITVAKNATFGGATTTLENATQTFAASLSTTNVASQLRTNLLGASAFTATSASNVATFSAPAAAPNQFNGQTIGIASATVAATSPTGTLTITSSGATRVNDITVNGVSALATKPYFFGDTDTSNSICTKLATLVTLNGFTATCSSPPALVITAPAGTTYNGTAISMTGSAVSAQGTLTSSAAVGAAIGSTGIISSNGTTIQAAQNFPALSTVAQVATQINGGAFLNSFSGGGTSAGSVTINAPAGNTFNNQPINVNPGTGSVGSASSGTVTITDTNTTAGVGTSKRITALTCGGTNTITTNTVNSGNPGLISNLTAGLTSNDINGYTISGCSAVSGSPQRSTCNITGPIGGAACTLVASLDSSPGFTVAGSLAAGTPATTSYTSFTQVPFAAAASGGAAVATPKAGYAAASGAGTMNSLGTATIPNYAGSLSAGTFPAATNPANVGSSTATANAGYAAQGATGSSLAGGVTPVGAITTDAPRTMAGGQDTVVANRANLGKFNRVDIVPSVNSYTKAVGRTDCAGASCTYNEELQNFANWYSYYRIRLLMMKSASTIAFDELNSKFRVGFDRLSQYNSGAVDLEVAQFVDTGGETANQRSTWWTKLTGASTTGSTPLRSEVNKIGRYYAGKLTTGSATPAVPETSATGSIGISSANNGAIVSSIKVEGVEILGGPITAACATTPCSSTQRRTYATAIKNAINAYVVAHPGIPQYVASCGGATCSTSTITLTAPLVTTATDPSAPTANGEGSYFNGSVVSYSKSGTITLSKTDFSGGVNSAPAIPATAFEPIQYSCQQNYTLLVTDGYWNSNLYTDQKQLTDANGNGSLDDPIGNQDNVLYDVNTAPNGVIRGQYDGEQTSTTCTDSNPSSCGTLADVAMYYYKTDLRDTTLGNATNTVTGDDIGTNNVFVSPNDDNNKQHMVFFGMGLGAPGTLRYRPDYLTAASGDYHDIAVGTDVSGTTVYKNWPAVEANDPTTIDDLWHATVNGHGKYFSARDPVSAAAGLKDALFSITARVGSAAAAATSNLKPVSGDNFAYVASYETVSWVGDVQARTINLVTGAVDDGLDNNNNSTCGLPLDANGQGCPWSAQVLLDAKAFGSRTIYIAPASGVTAETMRLFDYVNLSAGEKAYFDPSTLNQYASAHTSYPTDVTAANLVNYLRGDRSQEANGVAAQPQIWRKRDHVLGDIVSTQPAFVKLPSFTYLDAGYADFKTDVDVVARPGMLYISSNDGMLHALDATTGQERWAFIPKEVLPVMKVLADSDYEHRYFVDGQISVGDVNFGGGVNDWHTILVAGLGSGGKEYFALDITDPTAPVFLWEISNTTTGFANLGYSFGNASINKLPNGEWAVFFSSGYNNADGHGYLYAVNPETGALKSGFPMSTAAASPTGDGGTPASPSNLGKMSAWVTDVRANNTAEFFYGGDMNGNIWRFDLDLSTTGHTSTPVFKLAHLENSAGQVQPITTRLELTTVGTTHVIYATTGQYLSIDDPTNTDVQSLYAIKDPLGVPNLGGAVEETWNPRDDIGTVDGVPNTHLFLSRTITNTTDASGNPVRTICDTAALNVDGSCGDGVTIDYTDYGGWYVDYPDTGERSNVDMNLTLGTLVFPTNVPNSNACNSGGYSWINYIDFKTGLAVAAQNASNDQPIMAQQIQGALTVGINVVQLPGGSLAAIVTTSDYRNATVSPAFMEEVFTGHRDLWRELQVY